jgi:hypothetical protein
MSKSYGGFLYEDSINYSVLEDYLEPSLKKSRSPSPISFIKNQENSISVQR